jgi:hypothetical protein
VALVKLQDTTQSTDKIGSSYFVEENYDDFIMAKDPPTLTSMVPLEYYLNKPVLEDMQESANGILTFPFTIRNQFTTSLSTLQATTEMREELLAYQRDFYKNATESSKSK